MLQQQYLVNRHQRRGELVQSRDIHYLAYPNHRYWQERAESAGDALFAAIGEEAYEAFIDSLPENLSWLEMAVMVDSKLIQVSMEKAA